MAYTFLPKKESDSTLQQVTKTQTANESTEGQGKYKMKEDEVLKTINTHLKEFKKTLDKASADNQTTVLSIKEELSEVKENLRGFNQKVDEI